MCVPNDIPWLKSCFLSTLILSSWGFSTGLAEPLQYSSVTETRPHIRDLGVKIGQYESGEWNAITDVPGVKVGHVTRVILESSV